MKRFATRSVIVAAVAVIAVAGAAGVAYAQAQSGHEQHVQATPKNFNYEIKDGKRVPKSNRVANADGSWKEEAKVGNCTTIKEGTASGDVKVSRKCD